MRKLAVEFYLLFLWLLCGCGLYGLFRSWWPWTGPFWDSVWTGGLLIAVLAAIIVEPAGRAMGVMWANFSRASKGD
jgi:hypothetical protein